MRERRTMRSWLPVSALSASIALVAGAGLAGVSLALWNGAAPISETDVHSGTLTATVAVGAVGSPTATSATFDPATWDGMLPGERRSVTITVGNTGSTPFLVAGSLDAMAAASTDVTFALAPGACGAATGGVPLGAAPQSVGDPLPAGSFSSFCLTATASPDLPPETGGTIVLDRFTLTLDANQFRP